jgi:predicted aminopeptidase
MSKVKVKSVKQQKRRLRKIKKKTRQNVRAQRKTARKKVRAVRKDKRQKLKNIRKGPLSAASKRAAKKSVRKTARARKKAIRGRHISNTTPTGRQTVNVKVKRKKPKARPMRQSRAKRY